MLIYQTRHLEALRELTHGGRLVRPGERFQASPLDADYYQEKRMAREVPPVQAEPAPPPAPAPAPVAPSQTTTAEQHDAGSEGEPDPLLSLGGMPDADDDDAKPFPTQRRGRRSASK